LSIGLEERIPLCRLGLAEPPRYVDADGILFTRPQPPATTVPVVTGVAVPLPVSAFGKPVKLDSVRAVIDCLKTANTHSGVVTPLEFSQIILGITGRMTLILKPGVIVKLGAPDHLAEKIYVLRNTIVFLSTRGYSLNQVEHIDVRSVIRAAGLAADYKLRGQEGTHP